MVARQRVAVPKYLQVYEALRSEIVSGRWPAGTRVPSEADLVRQFGASRITVGRAVRDLQRAGLVERRVGAGTWVRGPQPSAPDTCTFAMLVPDAPDIEIFEPLVQSVVLSADARGHVFLRAGGTAPVGERPEASLAQANAFVARRVDGVFFAPLEDLPAEDPTNRRIVAAFDAAGIPVVLLDRAVHPYPTRGPYDLVGIDNRRVGFMVTQHLVTLGARRVAFLGTRTGASTIAARRAGYREALETLGADTSLVGEPLPVPTDRDAVSAYLERCQPDAVVCANDRGAAHLMHTLLALGRRIPDDVRLASVDDAPYAAWLPVPLTTVRQPVEQIGAAAMAAMLERLAHPGRPPRDIFVQCLLTVRRSCGATPS